MVASAPVGAEALAPQVPTLAHDAYRLSDVVERIEVSCVVLTQPIDVKIDPLIGHFLHRSGVDHEIGRASEIAEVGYWHQEDSRSRIMALEIADLIAEFAFQRDFGKEKGLRDVNNHVGVRRGT